MRDNPKRRCDDHQRSERALALVPDTGVDPFVHRVRLRCRRKAWLGPVMQHERYCCTLQLDSRVICLSTLLLGGTEGAANGQTPCGKNFPCMRASTCCSRWFFRSDYPSTSRGWCWRLHPVFRPKIKA